MGAIFDNAKAEAVCASASNMSFKLAPSGLAVERWRGWTRTVAGGGRVSWQDISIEIDLSWSNPDKAWSKSGPTSHRLRPNLGELEPILAESGPNLAEFGPKLATSDLAEIELNSVEFDQF